MSVFLPSLRASTSSSASTSAACCSAAPLSRRTVIHHPRLANPPKFVPKAHPAAFTHKLEGGAEFVYSPSPSAPPTATVTTLDAELSPNGKKLPPAWRRVPGYGFMAPRVDRLKDGSPEALAAGTQFVVPADIREELQRLRTEDPETWTSAKLAKKFGLTPFLVAKYAPVPAAHAAQVQHDSSLRLERVPLYRLVAMEARQIRKGFW